PENIPRDSSLSSSFHRQQLDRHLLVLKPAAIPDAVGAQREMASRPIETADCEYLLAVVVVDRPAPLALVGALAHESVRVQHDLPRVVPAAAVGELPSD